MIILVKLLDEDKSLIHKMAVWCGRLVKVMIIPIKLLDEDKTLIQKINVWCGSLCCRVMMLETNYRRIHSFEQVPSMS